MRKRLTLLTAVVVAQPDRRRRRLGRQPALPAVQRSGARLLGRVRSDGGRPSRPRPRRPIRPSPAIRGCLIDNIVVAGVKEGVTVTLTAPFEAIYVCVNGGGNVPSAANKTTFVGELSTSAEFPAAQQRPAQRARC